MGIWLSLFYRLHHPPSSRHATSSRVLGCFCYQAFVFPRLECCTLFLPAPLILSPSFDGRLSLEPVPAPHTGGSNSSASSLTSSGASWSQSFLRVWLGAWQG